MSDLTRTLSDLAERGTPLGSVELRERVMLELAEEASTAPRRPVDVARPAWIVLAAAAAVMVLLGAVPLLLGMFSDGEPLTTVPPTTPEREATVPTSVPETVTTTISPLPEGSPIAWIEPDWVQVGSPDVFGGEGDQYIEAVTIGGPGFVAVGVDCGGECGLSDDDASDAAVWVSANAVDWTRIAHDESVFGGPGSQDMIDVIQGGPGLVAVGIIDHAYWGARRSPHETRPGQVGRAGPSGRNDLDAAVWVSPDGLTWELVPDPDGVFSGPGDGSSVVAADEAMEAVAVGNGLIVAVGSAHEDAAVWVSTDGLSWQRVPHDDEIFGGPSGQWMHDVVYTGERFVAVGTDLNRVETGDGLMRGAVWTSEDGFTWLRVPPTTEVFGGEGSNTGALFIWTVTTTDGGLVAAGTSPAKMALWTSDSGLVWQRVWDESAPFAYPDSVKRFDNGSQLRHAPVKALAGFGDGVLPVGWDRDAAQMYTPASYWSFEHDLVPGQLYTTIAKTDVIVVGDRAVAVGYVDGDAAVWVATIND